MLLFAVFTLGYFFGVFLTLFVLMRKEKVEEYSISDNALDLANYKDKSSWGIFTQLTKINVSKRNSGFPSSKSITPGLQSFRESKQTEKRAYITS